jgi:hypothetical protein
MILENRPDQPIPQSSASAAPTSLDRRDAQRAAAAERMRLSRSRRRDGLRVIAFQIRESEVVELVLLGLLFPDCLLDRCCRSPERWW